MNCGSDGNIAWVKHDQSICPVADHLQVVVLLRNGDVLTGKAETYRWQRFYLGDDPRDITHFCIVTKPRDTPICVEHVANTGGAT